MAEPTTHRGRITRDDLEDKFRELEGDVREQAESARTTIIAGVAIAALVLLLLAFLLGARKGRKRSTIVEIRRV
ncbi:MAG TPA: hypothetical protein VF015_11445 [Acidimicrobiales bacterium]